MYSTLVFTGARWINVTLTLTYKIIRLYDFCLIIMPFGGESYLIAIHKWLFLHILTKLFLFFQIFCFFCVSMKWSHKTFFKASEIAAPIFFLFSHTKVCGVTHKNRHSLIVKLDIPPYLEDGPCALNWQFPLLEVLTASFSHVWLMLSHDTGK